MIKYNMPGLYEHKHLILFLLDLYHKNREFFRPNVKIESVFGNFPYCTWDGGRNFPHYTQSNKEEVLKFRDEYMLFGVHPRFIFTNPNIEEEDLDDRWCNFLLNAFNDTNSEIVINSALMENYIKDNYPSYKLVSSTTKCIVNPEKAIAEIANSDYYQICIDYNLNKNMEFLESIPKEHRHKVEFLCNAICPPNCPYRKQHYSDTGKSHMTYLKEKYTVLPYCGIKDEINHPNKIGQGNNLSFEDIEKYHAMGFQHFKLEGRTLDSGTVFAQFLYYLIDPKYHFLVIEIALRSGALLNGYNDRAIYEYQGLKKHSDITW